MIGEAKVLFGNLRTIFYGQTRRDKLEALNKLLVSTAAIAFVFTAFSDLTPSVPEDYASMAGGLAGFVVGCIKFSS